MKNGYNEEDGGVLKTFYDRVYASLQRFSLHIIIIKVNFKGTINKSPGKKSCEYFLKPD